MGRILITGASGFIGSHVTRSAARAGWDALGTYHSHPVQIGCPLVEADLTERAQVHDLVRGFQPDVIIHAAANANMDRCEDDPAEARRCNITATEHLVEAAENANAYLIFISTDAVFDGTRGLYSEEDAPNPTSVYAETKLAAEQVVLGRLPAAVARTSINYGHRLAPHQGSFYQDVLNALQAGKRIPVFYDQFRNPIEVGHFADALLDLARHRYAGLLHIAGSQRCSRQDFAEVICRQFGLPTDLLDPRSQDEVTFRVARPKDISMRVDKARSLLSVPLPDLEMGLRALSEDSRSTPNLPSV